MKAKRSNQQRPQARHAENINPTSLFLRRAACAFSITVSLGTALLVTFSLAAYLTPDPDTLVMPLGLIAAALTSFLGGMIATCIHKHHAPLPAAMTNALLFSALMILLSIPLSPLASGYSALICALLHAAVFALGALGAIVASRPAKPKKARRRTH